ncbi:autotransporter outer membrane beta-barrel domain-containing protein [Yersinia alsatica]|uniref:Autotransporter outer membrane beta-barrel domain-containing protein n=1 Tax=Yersinia alsatica TaxID=2890317 RepID=A0ABY5UQK3_9GAMM|nr:autotransporter outer membrane beta-barrel domain-containing protein [Yersinia alsatica]UWM45244.1 autotransporter outer membrane beta-barrel domain-containing protein [Yersinia alsatica]CNL23817.1 autotransporter protein [Yersinia frederiksenii]CNL60895.1 autotransporter protein [Yersinia frederiksenii]
MKIHSLVLIIAPVSLLLAHPIYAADVDAGTTNITSGQYYSGFSISHTVDTLSGGEIDYMMNDAKITDMSGGYIDRVYGGSITTLSGGGLGFITDGVKIADMSGGTIGDMLGGTITSLSAGDVGSMSADSQITTMSGGTLGPMYGNAQITTVTGGDIDRMYGNAYINDMSGATVGPMYGKATITNMLNSSVDYMYGTAKITNMSDSGIGRMYNNSQVINMLSGSIDSMYGNSSVTDMSGGTIVSVYADAQVVTMSEGQINKVYDNAKITDLTGGNIGSVYGDALILNMTGAGIDSLLGNAKIMDMSGGYVHDALENAQINFTGSAGSNTGGTLTGNIANTTNLTLANNGFMTIATGNDIFSGRLKMQGGTAKLDASKFATNSLFDITSGANNTLWAVADNSGVNVNLASGLTGTINTDAGVTLGVNKLNGDSTTVFNKTGAGTVLMTAANNYSSSTTLSEGTLKAGGNNFFSAYSDYISRAGTTLDLGGYHQTLQYLDNAGVVNFGGTGGHSLTITGDYIGNNGLLNMNSILGDDSSVTDKLNIGGNSSGTTYVQVNNLGGSGAQTLNGIELINVAGNSTGEFIQSGRIVAGAFDYFLARGANTQASNWYLTSAVPLVAPAPIPEPEPEEEPDAIPTVIPMPADPSVPADQSIMIERPEASSYSANLAAANNMFVTRLHDRLGETQYIDALTGEQKVTSMWLRNEGGHNRSRDTQDQLSTQANRYVLQLGGDIAQWSNNGLDRFHLGVMAGYGSSKSKTESRLSGYSARASVDGYSTGLYGTWYANDADKSGLYIDSWAQYSWFNNSVDGQFLNTEEYKSKGVTASVETGYTFKVGENAAKSASYFIQPKAQATWMGVKADDHKEANGTNVSSEGNGNIQTRLGVKAFMKGYSEQDKDKNRAFQPFVEANWIHNTKDFGTTMDGMTVKQDGAANIGELKLGVEGQISKKVNVWGNVGQQVGNKGYSDTSVMLGVKYNF